MSALDHIIIDPREVESVLATHLALATSPYSSSKPPHYGRARLTKTSRNSATYLLDALNSIDASGPRTIRVKIITRKFENDHEALDLKKKKLNTSIAMWFAVADNKDVAKYVPEVLAWDLSPSTLLGNGWVATAHIDALPLNARGRVVNFQLDDIVKDLASTVSALAGAKGHWSGILGLEVCNKTPSIFNCRGKPAPSIKASNLLLEGQTISITPGTSAVRFMENRFNANRDAATSLHTSEQYRALCDIGTRLLLKKSIFEPPQTQQEECWGDDTLTCDFPSTTLADTKAGESYVLSHLSLTPNNLLVDDSGTLKAIIGWEHGGVVPIWLALALPEWLKRASPLTFTTQQTCNPTVPQPTTGMRRGPEVSDDGYSSGLERRLNAAVDPSVEVEDVEVRLRNIWIQVAGEKLIDACEDCKEYSAGSKHTMEKIFEAFDEATAKANIWRSSIIPTSQIHASCTWATHFINKSLPPPALVEATYRANISHFAINFPFLFLFACDTGLFFLCKQSGSVVLGWVLALVFAILLGYTWFNGVFAPHAFATRIKGATLDSILSAAIESNTTQTPNAHPIREQKKFDRVTIRWTKHGDLYPHKVIGTGFTMKASQLDVEESVTAAKAGLKLQHWVMKEGPKGRDTGAPLMPKNAPWYGVLWEDATDSEEGKSA